MSRPKKKRRHHGLRPAQPGPAQPGPAQPNGDLLGALGKTRTETAGLVRALDAHRQYSEQLLTAINRHELDIGRMLRGITDVLDALDRLQEQDIQDLDTYRSSVDRVASKLVQVLGGNSALELIGHLGEIAQPDTHEVVEVRAEAEQPRDAVLKVLRRGIRYRGDLVRPASVIIASGKEKQS